MKRSLIAAAATLMIATSASAGSISFSLPNLSFPPAADVTVSKDCLATNATSQACLPQE